MPVIRIMEKVIGIAGYMVPDVLAGTKTCTWRLYDTKGFVVGDQIMLVNSAIEKPFAKALVTKVVTKPLQEIDDEDYVGHVRYESTEAMYADLRKYYGDRVTPQAPVTIYHFRLLA